MTCATCGSTSLADMHLPDLPAAVATVCLRCGSMQPVEQDVEQWNEERIYSCARRRRT
jgi:hypothetical protein